MLQHFIHICKGYTNLPSTTTGFRICLCIYPYKVLERLECVRNSRLGFDVVVFMLTWGAGTL